MNCQDCQLNEMDFNKWDKEVTPCEVFVVLSYPSSVNWLKGSLWSTSSGNLLHSALMNVGFKDSQLGGTFALKCVINDEEVDKKAIKACYVSLKDEIKKANPKLIIALGNEALQGVTGSSGIGNWRGKEMSYNGIPVLATYSPGAVVRNPKLQDTFDADILKAYNYMNGIKSQNFVYDIHYAINKESFFELLKDLKNAQNINTYGAADTETTTFDYWRPETMITCLGICVDDVKAWSVPLEHPQSPWRGQSHKIMAHLAPYLKELKWVGDNWKFDSKYIFAKYGIRVNYGPDNMLLSYASNENGKHDLKFKANFWCNSGDYDKEIVWPKKFDPVVDDITEKVNEYLRMDLRKLMKYNALDAFYSRHSYKFERERLLEDKRSARIYKYLLENGSRVFTEIEENGMWVDPERLANAINVCQTKIDETIAMLNSHIPKGWIANNLSPKQAKSGFNWNSTQQLGKLLFNEDGFNFPILIRTDKGAPSTAESVLIELGSMLEHPVVEGIGEYRKWAKYMSTYLKPWSHKLDSNNRIHPNFKLHGTVTGRLSGEDGVHQVPRDNFIRGLIGAPPGWSFFEIDGSQIELRAVAIIAQEPTMLRIFATGGDIHRTTAATVMAIAEDLVSSLDRKKAKAVNFGFVYGMGWKKFKLYAWEKYSVRLTDEEAKRFRKTFFRLYSELEEWHRKVREQVKEIGYVISPIGRKRRLPDIYSNEREVQAAAEREAINSPVQGFGSDYVLASFIDMVLNVAKTYDINWRDSLRPVGAVHDAQYWEIRNDMIDFWAPKIKANFDDASRLKKWFGFECTVDIPGDCKIGNHWGDAKDWSPGQPFPHTPR